jgi:hypothetical protein
VKEGFLGDLYNGPTSGPEGGAKMRWMKPGTDFSKYNKVMIDSVAFFWIRKGRLADEVINVKIKGSYD